MYVAYLVRTLKIVSSTPLFLFDEHGCTLVDTAGCIEPCPHPDLHLYEGAFFFEAIAVKRVAREEYSLPEYLVWARCFQPQALRALGVLQQRENFRFHPRTGEALDYHGHIARPRGNVAGNVLEIFPRIDPAIICRLELMGEEKILVGLNALRPHYYSLIAGYIEVGESAEDAVLREIREETGRLACHPNYIMSQAWPFSGSLMLGFEAYTDDREPRWPSDGELLDIQWLSREDVRRQTVNLPAPGTVAWTMIEQWVNKYD
ncbi:NUDIX domain-containing protein [Corynebacterium sp. ES2794-CONJ1]|uniref:NUDIX domain-containing protein n=1 Tax=unclassified Corynebacterium TaxID=2624378 RepID=UPI00216ACCD7|nr:MULTISPECIES: NAD(+) diphosphatase [unclassified Corynebacterium]MCS4531371.1 NUDIX domain-containing protein [Corynebacterium sp. ES2730-CONJ]MCU9518758.1 NUDIX domain-containing protein [Corynebacterium sp. ES2794-CONJ1]